MSANVTPPVVLQAHRLFLHRQIAQYLHAIVVYAMCKRAAMRANSLVNREMEADISETMILSISVDR